jgi:translation initiation factor 3 subunit F
MACDYVDGTIAGKIAPNHKVGRLLADSVCSIPKIDPAAFQKMFSSNMQDLLMVVYLTNLGKAQLAMAEKLNASMK